VCLGALYRFPDREIDSAHSVLRFDQGQRRGVTLCLGGLFLCHRENGDGGDLLFVWRVLPPVSSSEVDYSVGCECLQRRRRIGCGIERVEDDKHGKQICS
jgi:hypothetical protein